MKWIVCCAVSAALLGGGSVRADEARKPATKTYEIPYRLTVPKHIMVRAKINRKGPFNFILDTGAPALFLSAKACKKLGVEPDARGWAEFDRFEIEGGLVLEKAKGRVEDLYQLEGMNGLGLAGAELHGVIGYNIIARYRIEVDFTQDKMAWTELDWKPTAPAGLGGKAASSGGMEVIASLMKLFGTFSGAKTTPDLVLRGFLGVDIADGGDNPVVRKVLKGGPAERAGLKVGDVVTHVKGRSVVDRGDVVRRTKDVLSGDTLILTVRRGTEVKEILLQIVEGL